MGAPNLRLNKKITKKILQSRVDDGVRLITINWGMENNNKLYGSYKAGLFKTWVMAIHKTEDDVYRLLMSDGNKFFEVYSIEDIDEYLELVGAIELPLEDKNAAEKIIQEADNIPSSGLILVREGRLYVYDHVE